MNIENVSNWQLIMNSDHNPLKHLDNAAKHYIMQVLEPHAPDSYFAWNMFNVINWIP